MLCENRTKPLALALQKNEEREREMHMELFALSCLCHEALMLTLAACLASQDLRKAGKLLPESNMEHVLQFTVSSFCPWCQWAAVCPALAHIRHHMQIHVLASTQEDACPAIRLLNTSQAKHAATSPALNQWSWAWLQCMQAHTSKCPLHNAQMHSCSA